MTFIIQSVTITFQNLKNLHLPLFSGYAIYLSLRSTQFWGIWSLSLFFFIQIMLNVWFSSVGSIIWYGESLSKPGDCRTRPFIYLLYVHKMFTCVLWWKRRYMSGWLFPFMCYTSWQNKFWSCQVAYFVYWIETDGLQERWSWPTLPKASSGVSQQERYVCV